MPGKLSEIKKLIESLDLDTLICAVENYNLIWLQAFVLCLLLLRKLKNPHPKTADSVFECAGSPRNRFLQSKPHDF
jgi:hypothetical protein